MLSFGLGGREVAGKLLETAYESGKKQKNHFKADMRHGKNQAGGLIDDVAPEGLSRAGR